jgi:MFS superfamily sulfate permease-like transporter
MATSRQRSLPLLDWLVGYQKEWLPYDVIAGLVTAAVVIPKAMAYATIAGLPVQVGLYTALVPMIIYALIGTSGRLANTSTTAILAGPIRQVAQMGTRRR